MYIEPTTLYATPRPVSSFRWKPSTQRYDPPRIPETRLDSIVVESCEKIVHLPGLRHHHQHPSDYSAMTCRRPSWPTWPTTIRVRTTCDELSWICQVTKYTFWLAKVSYDYWSRRGGVHTNPTGTDGSRLHATTVHKTTDFDWIVVMGLFRLLRLSPARSWVSSGDNHSGVY